MPFFSYHNNSMKRLSFLIAFILAVIIATPALAITNPSSVNIVKVHATQNVLETGDILFMAEYAINYAVIPDELVNETFIFRLMDTDNSTELGRVLAYPYVDNGFGKGVISFYFSAATAPGTSQYIISICGNPAVFPSFVPQDFTMPASAYTVYSSVADTDIYSQVMIYATDLDPTYQTALGSSLVSSSNGAVTLTLSSVGEIYFTNAIPNLLNMSPSLFLVQASTPTASADSYNTTQADIYKNRFVSTWVFDSQAALGELLDTDAQIAMSFIAVALCIIWATLATLFGGNVVGGYILSGVTILGATLLGWVSMAVTSVVIFLCGVYIGMVLIFRGIQN